MEYGEPGGWLYTRKDGADEHVGSRSAVPAGSTEFNVFALGVFIVFGLKTLVAE